VELATSFARPGPSTTPFTHFPVPQFTTPGDFASVVDPTGDTLKGACSMDFTLTQECARCSYDMDYRFFGIDLDFATLPGLEMACHRCGYLTGQIQISIAFQAPNFQPETTSGHAHD